MSLRTQSHSEAKQESLTRSVHQLSGCQNIQCEFTYFVKKFVLNTNQVVCRQLLQIWLHKTVVEFCAFLVTCTNLMVPPVLRSFLSDTDQEVLYHDYPYIVRKLTLSATMYRKLKYLVLICNLFVRKRVDKV